MRENKNKGKELFFTATIRDISSTNWHTSKGIVSGYERWTNYETAETGVRYTDESGEWIRTSFTSREDNVSITKIEKSSAGAKINMIISIDDVSSMYKARDGDTELSVHFNIKSWSIRMRNNIAQVAHYPSYQDSEALSMV